MRKIERKCKRCGNCCEEIMLAVSPRQLEASYDSWAKGEKVKHTADCYILCMIFKYIRYDQKRRKYIYRCLHFERTPSGKGRCAIHKRKPHICAKYPFYGNTPDQLPNPSQYKGCGFNVDKNKKDSGFKFAGGKK